MLSVYCRDMIVLWLYDDYDDDDDDNNDYKVDGNSIDKYHQLQC